MLGVRPRATRLRQPGICDVAHQRMLELVLGLALSDGSARHGAEPSLLEPEQRARHRRLGEDAGERLQPEATPDDGRLLQHALVVAGEGVDASGDDAVDGVGSAIAAFSTDARHRSRSRTITPVSIIWRTISSRKNGLPPGIAHDLAL